MGRPAPQQERSDKPNNLDKKPLWSREQIAQRILAGENIFIYHSNAVRVSPSWLEKHPGGALAILHFVGRDATDEVDAFHNETTRKAIQKYVVARVDTGPDGWQAFVPPFMTGWRWHKETSQWVRYADPTKTTEAALQAEKLGLAVHPPNAPSQIMLVGKDTLNQQMKIEQPSMDTLMPAPSTLSVKAQAEHSAAYKELHKRVVDAGLYNTPYFTGIGPDVLRYLSFMALAIYFYQKAWYIPSAFFLGFMWHQLSFLVHDLGHMGVTHDWVWDRIIAIFVADFVGGLSIGWWVDNHNVHHLVTNHPTHDPDIEHLPFFAISPHFLSNIYSSYYKRVLPFDLASRIFLRFQHQLFYIVMAFARFNLYRLSWVFLFNARNDKVKAQGGRWKWWAEVIGIATFWTWYTRVLIGTGSWTNALLFLLVSHITTSPLHVQIVLSHYSRSTEDLGPSESFIHRQLRTTVDVLCPDALGWVHGGLHLQVTHHLFPRLPRHNLKRASRLAKAFAKEQGLEYAEFGFVEGNGEVRGVLRAVATQVRTMQFVVDENIKEAIGVAKT